MLYQVHLGIFCLACVKKILTRCVDVDVYVEWQNKYKGKVLDSIDSLPQNLIATVQSCVMSE